jgi:HlyD family secretion protein
MARPRGKSRRVWIAVALLVLIGAAGGWFYWRQHRDVIISVQTEKASRRSITELVVANGKIQPVWQVLINPEVSGEIIELPVKEGQPVKKGDLLVKIKPDNYLAMRNSVEASYRSALASKTLAAANLSKAELEFKRVKSLFEDKLVSDSQYLEAKTTLDVMKATHENSSHQADQAKASMAKAEDDLAKTTIASPMDGIVTKLRSQRGERVVGTALMAGTEIMTIADLEAMEARVDIGEMDILLIATGQIARLEVDAFRDKKFSGIVTEIANSSKTIGPSSSMSSSSSSSAQNQEATKFEVRIRVAEKEIFRPGMSVTAEIETRYRTNVLTVPIQSVTTRLPKKKDGDSKPKQLASAPAPTTDAGGRTDKKPGEPPKPVEVVFGIDNDHAKMIRVKRGISDDAYVEIVDGLDEGIEIISGGYKAINRELEDGKKVKKGPPEKDKDKEKEKT